MKTLVFNVNKIFYSLGLTRYALCDILSLPRHTVDDIFEGRKKLTLKQAHMICEFLETDLTDMLRRKK